MNASTTPHPLVERFVHELIQTGLALTDALSSLLESFEGQEPWPGEDTGEVLLAMTAGSVQIALRRVPFEDVESAIDLIAAARERFVGDLRLAAEVAARRESR